MIIVINFKGIEKPSLVVSVWTGKIAIVSIS
jgi:hypothetical protein